MFQAHGSALPSIQELQDMSRLKQIPAKHGLHVHIDSHTESRPYFRDDYMVFLGGNPTHNYEVLIPSGTVIEFTELPPDLEPIFRTQRGKLRAIVLHTSVGPRLRSTHRKRFHRAIFPLRHKLRIKFTIKQVPRAQAKTTRAA